MYCVKNIHGVILVLVVLFFDTVAAEQKPRVYYYVKDHLGSTRLVIDREKAAVALSAQPADFDPNQKGIVEVASYYPFGMQMPGKCATSGVNKRTTEKFTGKELDSDGQIDWNSANGYSGPGEQGLDLSYLGARYYDAEIGRWISRDPAEQFISPYLYSGNLHNPILAIDGDGEFLQPLLTLMTTLLTNPKELEERPPRVEGEGKLTLHMGWAAKFDAGKLKVSAELANSNFEMSTKTGCKETMSQGLGVGVAFGPLAAQASVRRESRGNNLYGSDFKPSASVYFVN